MGKWDRDDGVGGDQSCSDCGRVRHFDNHGSPRRSCSPDADASECAICDANTGAGRSCERLRSGHGTSTGSAGPRQCRYGDAQASRTGASACAAGSHANPAHTDPCATYGCTSSSDLYTGRYRDLCCAIADCDGHRDGYADGNAPDTNAKPNEPSRNADRNADEYAKPNASLPVGRMW